MISLEDIPELVVVEVGSIHVVMVEEATIPEHIILEGTRTLGAVQEMLHGQAPAVSGRAWLPVV